MTEKQKIKKDIVESIVEIMEKHLTCVVLAYPNYPKNTANVKVIGILDIPIIAKEIVDNIEIKLNN